MGNTCLKDAAMNPWISMKCIIIAKSSNINVSEVDGKRIEREKNPVVAVVGVVLKKTRCRRSLSIRMKISSKL